jgi:hypothetical protein
MGGMGSSCWGFGGGWECWRLLQAASLTDNHQQPPTCGGLWLVLGYAQLGSFCGTQTRAPHHGEQRGVGVKRILWFLCSKQIRALVPGAEESSRGGNRRGGEGVLGSETQPNAMSKFPKFLLG